jgi:hypothetical protein
MSKIALSGPATGTATFTITTPAGTSTDRTLTLPDAAGTIQVSGNPISGTTGTFTGLVNISAAGAGQIQFPATQNASANANTLDDYEEGTWTPTFDNQGTATFDIRNGRYTKIGNMVFAQFHIDIASTGTASGPLSITNLPFVVKNVSDEYGACAAVHAYNWTTARTGMNGLAFTAATTFSFFYNSAGTGGAVAPTFADIGTGNLLTTIMYMTD